MEKPRRWAVALSSDDAIDLTKARVLFGNGDPQVREIKTITGGFETALFSDQFDVLSVAADVADASSLIIDAINGICFVWDSDRTPLRRKGVHGRLPTGEWDGGTNFASVAITFGNARASGFAETVDKNGNIQPPPQSQQSIWLQNAIKDENTLEVLTYLRGMPDWFLIYKAYETMKENGGGAAGWPDTSRFTRSVNIRRHFSGHSSAKQTPAKPFEPMDLGAATNFVRTLATQWLNSRASVTKRVSK